MDIFVLILFLFGFFLLIKGADILIEGSVSLARYLKVSDIFIGLTIVSVGTSLPELFVSLVSNVHTNFDILLGNILGSNIANILLVLGLASLARRIVLSHNMVWKEIPFSVLAAIVLFIVANDAFFENGVKNVISFSDGLILILFYIVFLYYLYAEYKIEDGFGLPLSNSKPLQISIFMIALGVIMLYFGGELVVNQAVKLALFLGISQAFIGLTIVSIGTSIPELVTTIVALIKKNQALAIGNIVGSCITNIFFILGLSALTGPIFFSYFRNTDLFLVFVASLVLFISSIIKKEKMILDKIEGILFLTIYILYIAFLLL
ncbi:MAG: calcium/sodium antiporter [Candidatus Anstonellaceae archaeon]